MKINDLERFVKLCSYQSLNYAAKDMQLDVSVISRFVKNIEAELGTKLFVKNASSFSLTPFGQDFLISCRQIVTIYNQTISKISSKDNFVIRYHNLMINEYVINKIKIFLEDNHLNYEIYPSFQISENATILLDFQRKKSLNEFHFIETNRLSVYAVIRSNNPLSQQETVTYNELTKYNLISSLFLNSVNTSIKFDNISYLSHDEIIERGNNKSNDDIFILADCFDMIRINDVKKVLIEDIYLSFGILYKNDDYNKVRNILPFLFSLLSQEHNSF